MCSNKSLLWITGNNKNTYKKSVREREREWDVCIMFLSPDGNRLIEIYLSFNGSYLNSENITFRKFKYNIRLPYKLSHTHTHIQNTDKEEKHTENSFIFGLCMKNVQKTKMSVSKQEPIFIRFHSTLLVGFIFNLCWWHTHTHIYYHTCS